MAIEIVKVPEDAAVRLEQLGSKRKFWFNQKDGEYLFKEGRPGTGENWAEVMSCRVCELLGIPHADYWFAEYKEMFGVITKQFVPQNGRLVFGNEMLSKFVPGYEMKKTYKQRQYTLRIVAALLRKLSPLVRIDNSFNNITSIRDPLDVFIAYVMLDALIANQDRHHENWGVIVLPESNILAPTFDHASSLGRNELDDTRNDILATTNERRSIRHYINRAESAFYFHSKHNKRMKTIEALQYVSAMRPKAAAFWRRRLTRITRIVLDGIVADFPDQLMSPLSKEFACQLILHNKTRIIQA